MPKIPAGPCALCNNPAEYADSVILPEASGYPHATSPKFGWKKFCWLHAAERRESNESRVTPILWCEQENCFRLDFDRTSGECICGECGQPYRKHPKCVDYPFLNVLCDESLVKL